MLTPAVLANAVGDALGRDDIELPLTLNRVWALANGKTYERAATKKPTGGGRAGSLVGDGEVVLKEAAETVWKHILDPAILKKIVPGCQTFERVGDNQYRATVTIAVGGIRGNYEARIEMRDLDAPKSLTLTGSGRGALGWGRGEATVSLAADGETTRLTYAYSADVGGRVASVGQRMLGTVTRALIGRFFDSFNKLLAPDERGVLDRVKGWFGS
jgi:2-furoyl-CoA dehydrogenase large subunit